MSSLKESVAHGLRNVFTFRGRDTRAQFWAYAGCVLGAILIPLQLITFVQGAVWMASRPEGFSELPTEGMRVSTVIGAAAVLVLLAAAVSRRLHDSNRRGSWGLLPLPFLGYGLYNIGRVFDRADANAEPELGGFFVGFLTNVAYVALISLLVWMLVAPGSPGPNRFGDR